MTTLRKITNKYALLIVLIAVIVIFGVISPSFLSITNISNMFLGNMASAFLGLGGVFILVTNQFDLSLGYNLCLSMCTAALLSTAGAPDVLIIIIPLALGTFYGVLNGLMVVKLKIGSMIVTLALGMLLSGIAQAITDGGIIKMERPKIFLEFARKSVGPIAITIITWIACAIIIHIFLTQTKTGREMFAIGKSVKTSFMAGIKTDRVQILAFALAGFFAAFAGLILAGQLGSASSSYGVSLLLPAYAVVFLSTASFKPGYINIPGVLCSMALITIGTKGLQLIGADTYIEYLFQGIALMFAMWLSNRMKAKKKSGGIK